MSVLNFMFELDGNDKNVDVNKQIDDKEELDELKKLNRKEIVGSKFVNVNANANDNLIEHNKLNNDPLYLLKKEQIHRRNKILLNEYKMKKIKRSIKEQKAKEKERKKKKKRKKQRTKDKKLKELLLKSLNDRKDSDRDRSSVSQSRSRSRSSSRSRSREHRHRHRSDKRRYDHDGDKRHNRHREHRDRHRSHRHQRHDRYRSRSRSRSQPIARSISPKTNTSKNYGLIYSKNKVCGVKMDKSVTEIKHERNTSNNKKYNKNKNRLNRSVEDKDDETLLKEMMNTADEYDRYRKERLHKYQNTKKPQNDTTLHNKDGAYLSEMANKLYMNHTDTLESRLKKNTNHLLKRNKM